MPPVSSLLGRDAEIGAISRLLDAVPASGSALLVRGAPGSGKSALLHDGARRATEAGIALLAVTGVQAEAQMPFAGLQRLLGPVLDELGEIPEPQRQALRTALSWRRGSPDLYLVGLATLSLLSECAGRRPILVVVDDAQWLDVPTSDVLAFVARRLDSDPIVMVIAIRDRAGTAFDTTDLDELWLEPLDRETAAAVLDARWPNLATALRARVLGAAEGNPLALVELPRALMRDGEPMAAPMTLPLTKRLEQAFAIRADELPTATRTVLLVAALNDSSSLDEALRAATFLLERPPTLEDIEPAIQAGLIEVSGHELRFRHPLMRSATRDTAGLAERHAAHRALAEMLVAEPDRRIWHRVEYGAGPDEALAAELEATAERMLGRRGTDVALAALRRAAVLSTDPVARGRRLVGAAQLAFDLGRHDAAAALLDDVALLDLAPSDRNRALCIREAISDAMGTGTIASAVALGRSMATVGETDAALESFYTAALKCYWFVPDQHTRDEVVAAAERLPVDPRDATLLSILLMADPLGRGALVVQSARESGVEDYEDPEDVRRLGAAFQSIHGYPFSETLLEAAVDGLRAQARLGQLARALQSNAWNLLDRGRWSATVHTAEEARRLARETSQPRWAATAGLSLAHVVGARGDTDRAETLIAQSEQLIAPTHASPTIALVQMARAAVACTGARYGETYDYAYRLFDGASPLHDPISGLRALSDFAEAAARTGQVEQATRIVERMTVVNDCLQSSFVAAHLAHARAVLSADDEAEALFRAARPSGAGWPFLRARTALAYGTWLRRQRRAADARAPLREAREAFDALGAEPWSKRARQELRASGESTRRRRADTRDQLTSQELQIAQMAAEALTNREIAERLFLSHRTVGSHLYHIYPKLNITSRQELRDALEHATVTDATDA